MGGSNGENLEIMGGMKVMGTGVGIWNEKDNFLFSFLKNEIKKVKIAMYMLKIFEILS